MNNNNNNNNNNNLLNFRGAYIIPERKIVKVCREKLKEEMIISYKSPKFRYAEETAIAIPLMIGTLDYMQNRAELGIPLGLRLTYLEGLESLSLSSIVRWRGIYSITKFINEFISSPQYKLDQQTLYKLTEDQKNILKGYSKDWSWSTYFFGRAGLPKFIHETGRGVWHYKTTKEDIEKEIKNARKKGKIALQDIFRNNSKEVIARKNEMILFQNYVAQIDKTIGTYSRLCIK